MPFEDTASKAAIRQLYDLPEIARLCERLNRSLAYFGLTGPEIRDLIDWKEYLCAATSVESPGRTKEAKSRAEDLMGQLAANAMFQKIPNFELLRADVERVLLDGVDSHGTAPQMNDGAPAQTMKLSYDLVNLDFVSGICYRNTTGNPTRLDAIRRLFDRQAGHGFILLITVTVRDNLGEEPDTYLQQLGARYPHVLNNPAYQHALECGDGEREYKLKPVISTLIQEYAETRQFAVECRPPIFYVGHGKARMLHFVFLCEPSGTGLRAFSEQQAQDLLGQPLLRVEEGHFTIDPTWVARGVDLASPPLGFLSDSAKEKF